MLTNLRGKFQSLDAGLVSGKAFGYTDTSFGVWRRLVARLHGVQEAQGSNPCTPTHKKSLSPLFEWMKGSFSLGDALID
jgi:hypothetical protein